MELPKITTSSGVLTYYLAAILAFAFVIAVYLLAVYFGLAPGFSAIPR